MKKILSSVIASLMFMSFVLSSCSQISDDEAKTDSSSSANFGKYSEFGASVKSGFEEKFGDAETARSALLSETSVKESDETDENVEYLDEDASGAEYLLENNYISETAAAYIKRVESAIDNAASKAGFNKEVSAIETEAMKNLSDSDLDSVMYYAEAAKASADYWAEDDGEARFSFRKFRKRIKKIMISSSLGTLAGGLVGGAASGGSPIGIAAGAVKSCLASAKEAYDTGKISVVVKI